ncbi:histidine phosphatase family protein [Sphingobium lactosutens]|uniref:histidine phosphatase family protein n=1 Tax=Sphingobium lactosutens TaxID=522773 RepID=UPI0015BD306D|nr:histidine phosphatase family protein [Sphingobium lactosutens]NWK97074.1 histidine phosphatase family protein [Sphingobium lactosutens]
MRRIFVIRHGNTFASGEEPRRIGARTDIPLVESGRVQAAALGDWFSGQGVIVSRLLSSPLLRAHETAGAIAAATGHELDGTRDWLGEIDHGPDEGLSETDVLARIGPAALALWEEQGVAPDGWIVDADMRLAAWRAFFAERGEGVDLLVTSNGAARFALLALGLPPRKLRTGAFGELAVATDGSVSLVRWDARP